MNKIVFSHKNSCLNSISWCFTLFLFSASALNPNAIASDYTATTQAAEPSVENKLDAIRLDLNALNRNLSKILSRPPDSTTPEPRLGGVVNQLNAVDNKLGVLQTRMGSAIDQMADDHVLHPDAGVHLILDSLETVQSSAKQMDKQISEYLEMVPPDQIPASFREALAQVRFTASNFALLADFDYYTVTYKRNIPVRFVQFFDHPEQILTDEQLQDVIDVTNRVFRPALIRFHLWRNYAYYSPEFAQLRGDDNENLMYEWPDDVATSPLLKRLYYPDDAYCELGFERPPNNTETRLAAQMRAGTYCAPVGEILVYVNQGYSNGGQYPWTSRIIGMTRDHVLHFVFQHEVGHYLGLPHTFPGHQIYGLDYSFGTMIGAVAGEDLSTTLRRYYENTDRLWNTETQQWAEFPLFWDLVFGPDVNGNHQYFWNLEAASQWDGLIQPIEQLASGVLCRRNDVGCDESVDRVRLEMTVAAGCKGEPRDFNDCDMPAVKYYTGDPEVRAFSREGSTPDTIQLNVMAYFYNWADGTPVFYNDSVVDNVFLSTSQIEQINRVLTYDIATPYEGISGPLYGLRPELNVCGLCH